MNLLNFLTAVVPSGKLVVARMVDKQKPHGEHYKAFSHTVCDTHEAAENVIQQMVAGKYDVYFATAAYKQGFHTNEQGKKVLRVGDNVASLKALWFDIDFKDGYADAKGAVKALADFCTKSKMPPPAILVASGHGLHAYWPFDDAIAVDRWKRLSGGLKGAAKAFDLHADLVCTGDACRVLRPPGTLNFKDPANPKPVSVLYSSGKTYSPDVLEAILLPFMETKKPTVAANADLGVGSGTPAKPSLFGDIAKHCPAAKHVVEVHGKDCREPEWMAWLQLLKHCEDGAMWVHPISDGHNLYSPEAADRKWEQRQHNNAGPTLCRTIDQHRPTICSKCPHNGFIKSPIQLGYEGVQDAGGLPPNWRVAPDQSGVERLYLTDAAAGTKEWVKVLGYIPTALRVTRSAATGQYDFSLDIHLRGAGSWTLTLPTSFLGNTKKLQEACAGMGVLLDQKELKTFGELMNSWIKKLQSSRRVVDVADQLGWMYDGEKVVGFACSPTVYYTDGRTRDDVRPNREFANTAKMYEPKGSLDEWKNVAAFLAQQNSPALTAVLAASFGAPLLKFMGLQGGTVSLVSSASGVGKSSALKCSQAVWGNPIHAVNSVDDTPKSVIKKLTFLNNLPAYWDELRGRRTVDDFAMFVFQLSQGKDRSRLDSSATLKDTQSWETMMVVASNESIFDAMARKSSGSDAGVVRVFEMIMETTPESDKSSAELTIMFEKLAHNYGHAGRVYAQHIATNLDAIRDRVQKMFVALAKTMEPQERFWYGIVSVLIVGASEAAKCGLVHIDIPTLHSFLIQNIARLRERSFDATHTVGGHDETLARYMQEKGDNTLLIDAFPTPKSNTMHYVPEIISPPRSNKLSIVIARDSGTLRFNKGEFLRWCDANHISAYGTIKRLLEGYGGREIRCQLGIGTKYQQPSTRCLQIPFKLGCSASPVGSPDSSSSTSPEGSPAS